MSQQYILAYDLGTGGCKSSLYDTRGECLGESFQEYPTHYPHPGWHEQDPEDWWRAIVDSTRRLLSSRPKEVADQVIALGMSGHSLGMVPLDADGRVLLERVPIWSDGRPGRRELETLFRQVPEEEWYLLTGNGFPARHYAVFKILWFKNAHPEAFAKTTTVLGSKDYINFRLSGRRVTDYSYASGSGVYDLRAWGYSDRLLTASGLPRGIFPGLVKSSEIIGTVTAAAARELGISPEAGVVAGGVDNSCMALGAMCFKEGRIYNSLGSSSWIAVSAAEPILDAQTRPFVFTHVVPGQFASATAIFAAGSSYKWYRDLVGASGDYQELEDEAAAVPPGADGLMFNPTLGGGSSLDKSPYARGGFAGLTLGHQRGAMTRAVLEGISIGLRLALDELRKKTPVADSMLLVGGGGKSPFWRQLLADIYRLPIVQTNIDQQAATLGAAALALVGRGVWKDFEPIDGLHREQSRLAPDPARAKAYDALLPRYRKLADFLSDDGEALHRE